MCPGWRILLDWLCLVVCRGDGGWPVEKEGSACRCIVRELFSLLGEGIDVVLLVRD